MTRPLLVSILLAFLLLASLPLEAQSPPSIASYNSFQRNGNFLWSYVATDFIFQYWCYQYPHSPYCINYYQTKVVLPGLEWVTPIYCGCPLSDLQIRPERARYQQKTL